MCGMLPMTASSSQLATPRNEANPGQRPVPESATREGGMDRDLSGKEGEQSGLINGWISGTVFEELVDAFVLGKNWSRRQQGTDAWEAAS